MNAIAILYVNSHLQSLAIERQRTERQPKRTLRERLGSIAGVVRSAFADPAVTPGSVVPAVH